MSSKERWKNWTKSQCIQLIREFRKRPEMWDPKHRLYYNKTVKRNGWRDIGATLNMSAERCKFKMNTVMSGFRREKAKFLHGYFKQRSGEIDPIPSRGRPISVWFGFQELAFLLDKETERARQNTGVFDEQYDMNRLRSIVVERYNKKQQKSKSPVNLNEDTEIRPGQSLLRQSSIEVKEEPVEEIMVSTESINSSQEIDFFSNFMASKLKRYPEPVKNSVQKAICEVIFKADQNFYENVTDCDKFTIIDDPLRGRTFVSD